MADISSTFLLRSQSQVFSEGSDVSIFACGHLVWKAIEAAPRSPGKRRFVEVSTCIVKPSITAAVPEVVQENQMRRSKPPRKKKKTKQGLSKDRGLG